MDDSSVQKVWEKPWSTEEIRRQCSSWNLAGDAGLLKHLQEFSQNLMQKTHSAEVALDSLLEDMRNTSVDVQNATNALLMLSNNQFVENRVYDDCEDEKEEVGTADDNSMKVASSTTASNGESVLIAKAAEAILLGMAVIDTKFDCVEVPASDSEGEEDGQNATLGNTKSFALVLEPRNPYSSQPLPHLIGSKEFMEDDRVGLGGGDEEDDEEEEDDDALLSLGQDLATHALDDSGSSLAGDMVDEGIFDEVDDRRTTKGPTEQAWESSSSNGSDNLVVENNIMRKKPKKMLASCGGTSPFGNEEDDEGDLFGAKNSSSGDEEFLEPIQRQRPSLPKSQKEDIDGEAVTKQAKVIQTKSEDEASKKGSDVKSAGISRIIPSDSLFGPPQDEWKENEDVDSIFAGSDGIFSGGRGLFDDLEDPFMSGNRRDANQFQPPSLPEEPPIFKGTDGAVLSKESREIIFVEDDEQDVFGSVGAKVPAQQQVVEGREQEEGERKQPKHSKGVEDRWIFDDPDQDEPLWNVGAKKEISHRAAADGAETEKSNDVKFNENTKADIQPKLPVGARSFYAGGIDPLALGKKLTKELEGKRKIKQQNASEKMGVGSKTANSKVDNADRKSVVIEEEKSVKVSKYSPDSGSMFDDLDDADDLFASACSKAKDMSISDKGDPSDKNLFAPIKSASISAKVEETQKKPSKTISSGVTDKSKNLFGDFGSDDEDDIFSGSKAGLTLPRSKSSSRKEQKIVSLSPDPLFDDVLGKDEELYPGSLEKNMFSENKVEDDLFSDLNGGDESIGKEGPSKEIKTEVKVPLFDDDKDSDIKNLREANNLDKYNDSDSLFGFLGVKSMEEGDSMSSGKASGQQATHHARNTKIEFDDIFGDIDDDKSMVVGAVKSVDTTPRIGDDAARSTGAIKHSNAPSKTSKLEILFDDFMNDEEDNFLCTSRHDQRKSSHPPSDSLFSSKPTNSKDLFLGLGSDGDNENLFAPKGGKVKADPHDPLPKDADDLFSSANVAVLKKIPPLMKDEPLSSRGEGNVERGGTEDVSLGSTRKSPPKTLDLGKVIGGWPAAGEEGEDDDRIVQAWMKGQPPPLRDSKVETTTPHHTTPKHSDEPTKKREDLNSAYFADIPSASLLHSHGKERARIQSHRRPPSRKVRKGSAASVEPHPLAAADEEVKAVFAKDEGGEEEDGASLEGTVEEWSTPEAGLASPPPLLPPSNPLSPSTDEEQDFFDVLPIGLPPVEPTTPSSLLSPFSDAVGGEGWDDGALFEDAQPGSLWDAHPPLREQPPAVVGIGTDDLQAKHLDTDLFSKGSATAESEQGCVGSVPKKTSKSGRRESGSNMDDELWGGNGALRPKMKDDIFAEDFEPSQAAASDLDDIFQGEGDLFGSSKILAASQEVKKASRGNSVTKGMGKSLSKLDSKTKGAPVSSLFGDDDDTEDLFSSPHSTETVPRKASNSKKKSNAIRATAPQLPTKSSLVKVAVASDDSTFEDPLMVLKRKE